MFMIISINNRKFKVKTVFTPEHTQKGMMGRKFGPDFKGMLFLMDNSENCFWMKNCVIDLDIIFIQDNQITKIFHSCPPCKGDDCKNYCSNGDTILEIEGGSCKKMNISEGDFVEF